MVTKERYGELMCSLEDEQQTPVTPILLNNHPKPHPNHSKGHVQPPHRFLLPPPPSTQEAPSPFSFVPGTRASNVTTVALRRAAPEHPRGLPPPDFTTTAPNLAEPDRSGRWQRRCSKTPNALAPTNRTSRQQHPTMEGTRSTKALAEALL